MGLRLLFLFLDEMNLVTEFADPSSKKHTRGYSPVIYIKFVCVSISTAPWLSTTIKNKMKLKNLLTKL